MGCHTSETIAQAHINPFTEGGFSSKGLTVATLNYCGILNSPYQFYVEEFDTEFKEISRIFKALIPEYMPDFTEETFRWQSGNLDKKFRSQRYSPIFSLWSGIQDDKLMKKKQFEAKWQEVFKAKAGKFLDTWQESEKQALKTYDTIMYHTLLKYCFEYYCQEYFEGIDSAHNHNVHTYICLVRPFFNLCFLDEEKKMAKFLKNYQNLNTDVFFIQQYSQILAEHFEREGKHFIATDKEKDTLILARKTSFSKIHDSEAEFSKLDIALFDKLNCQGRSAFMFVDQSILICLHLSSKKEINSADLQSLIEGLLELRKARPSHHIIVGGDINSFLAPSQTLTSAGFSMYPVRQTQLTTIKKRTYTQAQYHKADKLVQESKDKIISTLPFEVSSVCYIDGHELNQNSFLPSAKHPFDHFTCISRLNL